MKLLDGSVDDALRAGVISEQEAVDMYYWQQESIRKNDPHPPQEIKAMIERINLYYFEGTEQ